MLTLIRVFVTALLVAVAASAAAEGTSGVIFLYHHVDDATPRSTSVSRAEFAAQLDYLEREAYAVVPLMTLIDALANGGDLPEKSVAITFDDGYRTILTGALPGLAARGWPFTVFVSTEAVDRGYGGFLSWDEIRTLTANGASIGNHSVTHAHLVRREEAESEAAWRSRIADEIGAAGERLRSEVGDHLIPVFAYPYGEYTAELKEIVAAAGLYGLGQHSGAVGAASDLLALPRYPIASGLDLVDDFALRARSLPLPAIPVGSEPHIVDDESGRPELRLRLEWEDDIRLADLACYVSAQGRLPLEWISEVGREFVVRPTEPLRPGRSKLNCTAPSASRAGSYYWYGYVWMRRMPDGRWYDE